MSSEPISINLSTKSCIEILVKYVEVAQQKGAFVLQEADLLKRSIDVLVHGATDKDASLVPSSAQGVILQAIHKGQSKGCYTLNDAFLLHNAIVFLDQAPGVKDSVPASVPVPVLVTVPTDDSDDEFDLSELSKPVPLNHT
jgi:hypothetical protein